MTERTALSAFSVWLSRALAALTPARSPDALAHAACQRAIESLWDDLSTEMALLPEGPKTPLRLPARDILRAVLLGCSLHMLKGRGNALESIDWGNAYGEPWSGLAKAIERSVALDPSDPFVHARALFKGKFKIGSSHSSIFMESWAPSYWGIFEIMESTPFVEAVGTVARMAERELLDAYALGAPSRHASRL